MAMGMRAIAYAAGGMAIMMVLSAVAIAQPKKSRSQIAADGWLKAMTDATTIAPSYDKKRPLAFTVQGEGDACAKLKSGKATSASAVKALKACFVATWSYVAKEAVVELRDMKSKDLDGDQLRFSKKAPKGTTWVGARRSYAGQDLAVTMALGPDSSVIGVWFVYLENDGE